MQINRDLETIPKFLTQFKMRVAKRPTICDEKTKKKLWNSGYVSISLLMCCTMVAIVAAIIVHMINKEIVINLRIYTNFALMLLACLHHCIYIAVA